MDLKKLRQHIDRLDAQLISLLSERAAISQAIGQQKIKFGKSVYSPDREKEVLNRIKALNRGPMTSSAVQAIYREIMSCSLSLEKPLQIATLGSRGSYTHTAAQKIFGLQVKYLSSKHIPEVFQKVENGECDYGVVPIENSTEGAVTPTFDLLVDSELKICRQDMLEIKHNLLVKRQGDKIKKIYSNPQVFGQCRHWLLQHLPDTSQIWVASTTEAAERTLKEKNAAAIASREAAEIYGLKILFKDIHDMAHNTTRFFVLGNTDAEPTGRDRTTILFSIKDRVGALYHMLQPFNQQKINLTKIESRPSKKRAWDYYFFVDFEGHRLDKPVQKALIQLEDMCKYLKVLGSYPVLE